MSYLSSASSSFEYGVVQIGGNIDVTDGVISVAQSLYPNANVTFNSITVAGALTSNGAQVVTTVTPTASFGIALSDVVTSGPSASFTVTNTGVTTLTAGSGISLSANTGNIVISSYGADLINVVGVSSSYTATLTDEYIGVSSAGAVTITLPVGANGRVYTIKDEYGQGSGKITIQPQSGQLIDTKTTYIISVPNQSVGVVFRATGWWII
jgi:hypothetical protein